MDFIRGFERNQLQMISFENCVAENSWARIVDLFVNMLPLSELGFTDTPGEEGRPPYHPGDLLKLYLYGYKHGVRSSRKRVSIKTSKSNYMTAVNHKFRLQTLMPEASSCIAMWSM